MPADVLDTLTKFINSPPGQLVAGAALAGIVWKFFERVEGVLTDDTKLEIAVWLLDRKKVSPKLKSWPETFAKVFDRVFGPRHFSVRSVLSSCVSSLLTLAIAVTLLSPGMWISFRNKVEIKTGDADAFVPLGLMFGLSIFFGLIVPDFISILETRLMLKLLRRYPSILLQILVLVGDAVLTMVTAVVGANVGLDLTMNFLIQETWLGRTYAVMVTPWIALIELMRPFALIKRATAGAGFFPATVNSTSLMFFPGCVSSIWLWLYAGAGFLLKAARRFDLGFSWFNRHFDIEKKPLQSIGLVAGAIVAMVYWGVVAVHYFVS